MNTAVAIAQTFEAVAEAQEFVAIAYAAGLRGERGPSGSAGNISADAGNAITTGTDGGLFSPEAFALAARFSEIAGNEGAVIEARQNLGLQNIDCGTFN
jgi:hypothetical protein